MDKVDKTYYINLEKRKDRDDHINEEFKKISFDKYTRFNAVETSFGGLGCALSHIGVLEQLEKDEVEVGMILEDDAEFLVPRDVIDGYIELFMKDDKAEVLLLGYSDFKSIEYNELFRRGLRICTTSCYLVKNSIIGKLKECFEKSSIGLKDVKNSRDFRYSQNAIDQHWHELQQTNIFIIPKMRCVKQYGTYSDIVDKYVDRKF